MEPSLPIRLFGSGLKLIINSRKKDQDLIIENQDFLSMLDNQKSPDQCWSGLFDVFPICHYLK